MLRTTCTVPPGAEVISSIGDALSLLRAERERTTPATDAALIDALVAEVEAEITAAGAAPSSIEVRVIEHAEKGTVRAVATGAVALASGAVPGREAIDRDTAVARAGLTGASVEPVGAFWVGTIPGSGRQGPRVVALDRWGDTVVATEGDALVDPDPATLSTQLADAVARHTRHRGPVTREPTIWVLYANRATEIDSGDRVATALTIIDAARHRPTGAETVAVLIGSE
jgi:hypothetical protein